MWSIFLLLVAVAWAAPEEDKVRSLPLANFTITFDHYSGYLQASDTKRFHYWFVNSQLDPRKESVILWLNGGPGCSSMIGLIEELGPFKLADNGNVLYENKHSWNKFANLLFIESPAGVGYSYDTTGNTDTGDDETAQNNYNALVDFFAKFPEFRSNDFYISGESYGGVYLPTLGSKIVDDKVNFPNFKGMAIGNGVLNFPNNYNTMVPLYYYHGIVRQELWDHVSSLCCNGNILTCNIYGLFSNVTCKPPVLEILNAASELDSYNLYSTCYLDSSVDNEANHIKNHLRKVAGLPELERTNRLPLCDQPDNTGIYLNRRDVRTALHIPGMLPSWSRCADIKYSTTHFDMTPEVEKISRANVRILIYNGDVDTVCNHVMNSNFLQNLNRTILGKEMANRAWYYRQAVPNVAGFMIQYEGNIDFLTVRGSGHFVPQDKPREALQMIHNWVRGTDYSTPFPF